MTETPLMLNYRFEYHRIPASNDSNGCAIPLLNPSELHTDNCEECLYHLNIMSWVKSPDYQGYYQNFPDADDLSFSSDSFKIRKSLDHDHVFIRFNIITGQTVIGEMWMPVYKILKTKGSMMKLVGVGISQSSDKVYKALHRYERGTKYIRIHLMPLPYQHYENHMRFMKIGTDGSLTYPVKLKLTFSNGKIKERTMNSSEWSMLDDNGDYLKYEVEVI